jgi:hypothetical protein
MPELQWRKSSYSHGDGGNCVEVAWRKSSHSHGDGGDCVEVGWHKSTYSESGAHCVEVANDAVTLVRDTQNRERGALAVPAREWVALLADLERL